MENLGLKLLRVILVVVGIGMALYGATNVFHRQTAQTGRPPVVSQARGKITREQAMERIHDPVAQGREAAARALGPFEDGGALEALEKMMDDKDPGVRLAAIRAIGSADGERRLNILRERAAKKQATAERIATYSAWLRIAQTAKDKTSAIHGLLTIAANPKDPVSSKDAVFTLMGAAPMDPAFNAWVKKTVLNPSYPWLVPLLIRHLGTMKDLWTLKNLKTWLESKDPEIRTAGIEIIHAVCPPDRWELLRATLLREKDEAIALVIIREATLMPGDSAKQFFDKLLLEQSATERVLVEAKRQAETILKSESIDPCEFGDSGDAEAILKMGKE